MNQLNRHDIIGHLGANPDFKELDNGAVAYLSVCTNESWTDKATGEKKHSQQWHKVVLWNKLATLANEYTRKGSQVFISGPSRVREWEDTYGVKHNVTEIHATEMQLLDKKQG